MKKKWFLIVIIIAIFGVGIFFYNKKNIYINIVLSQSSYNYLPKEAKNYIKEVYNKTGNVLKTEKNKEKDNIYLNPKYVNYLTMSKENNKEEIPVPVVVDYTNDKVESEQNIPDSYDLRNIDGKNYITPVRDQGNLGICWTFATAGAMESKILKENYSNNQTLISERQIDYATSTNGIKDYRSEYISFISRGLGEGGNFYIATVAMANGISLYNYNAFKEFNDEDLDNMELSDVLSYKKSSYEVDSTINMETLNLRESSNQLTESEKITRTNYLNDIKTNIMKNGAAYLGTYMNNSCIYKDKNINGYILDVYNCSKTGGHAMQIIGWDDNKEYFYCGGLISNYKDNENSNDTTEANLILENIVFKNNKITGVYNDSNKDSSYRTSYGGGLLGNIESKNGAININNIYLDNVLEVSNFIKKSSFIETLFAKEANISNIRLGGTINGKYGDGSGDSIFNNKILANTNVDIKNIFSSVDGNNISGNFFGDIYSDNINVSNIKVLKINDNGLCRNDTNCFINDKNVVYEKSDIKTLIKKENYAYWDNFDDNWIIKTVNGIPRFPVLKNIPFEYTNINNITYQQELNKKDNIYNYITPNYDIAKRISYKSNNLYIVDLYES